MNNKITVTGANILFFIFTVLYLLFQIVLAVVELVHKGIVDNNTYTLLLVNQYVLILIPIIIFMVVRKLSFKEVFRLNNPGLVPCLLIIICALPAIYAASIFNTVVVYLLQFIGKIPLPAIPVPKNLTELFIGILVIAVSPAICEEMLHRGIMLKAYERRGSVKAIVISAIIFGFFHFDITNLFGPMVLGALIGYYVVRTNSIFAGMLAHFSNNAIAELSEYLNRGSMQTHKYITVSNGELATTLVLAVVSAMILAALLLVFNIVTKKKCILKPSIGSVGDDIKSVLTHWPIICVLVFYVLMALIYLLAIVAMKYYPA